MSYPDILIIIPLLYGAYRGFCKGFIMELSMLIALVLAVWGAMKFSSYAAIYLRDKLHFSESVLTFTSFLCVFLAIVLVVVLMAKIIEGIIDLTAMGIFNKLAGAVFGILKWTFVLMIIIHFLTPLNNRFHFFSEEKISHSYLFSPLKDFSQSAVPLMNVVINKNSSELLK
jgi:membrane protein required for colicin V production